MEDQQPGKLKRFTKECIRVLKVIKKPNKMEFKTIVKASGLGMAVIGVIGFILEMIKAALFI